MAFIYKIVNDINDKIYVGKTYDSINHRFQRHCQEAKQERSKNRPLYRAINKYGINHFKVELIEETDKPEEREKYWIEYYKSFGTDKGYNATLGGDGRPYVDYDLVVDTYQKTHSQKETCKLLGITEKTSRKILKEKGIKILTTGESLTIRNSKKVQQFNLKDEPLAIFISPTEAARSLGKKSGTHIGEVCRGQRQTAYGYKWKYI